jgi:hypothetical protein
MSRRLTPARVRRVGSLAAKLEDVDGDPISAVVYVMPDGDIALIYSAGRREFVLRPVEVRPVRARLKRLSDEQLADAMTRLACGESQRSVAARFGVSRGCIAHHRRNP